MRKYSIVAFVTASISCLSACGGPSSDPRGGSSGEAGMAGAADNVSGAGGKGAGTAGRANATGGEANGEAGASSEAGAAGAIGASGGTASTLGGAAGATSIGGGTAGASTGGANATAGAAGSVAAAGATTGGVAETGGTANGGASDTGGAGSTSIGGTAGTSGTAGAGTGGADTGGTSGGDAGGAASGGTGGIGGTSGAGGPGIGPNTACGDVDEGYPLKLVCPGSSIVTEITYASYGTPTGSCGSYTTSNCDSATSAAQVEAACLGHNNCTVNATNDVFGDPCGGTYKHLSVQATCSTCGNGVLDPGEVCDDGKTDGVLCSADCSTEPEVAQILVDCGPGTTEINSLSGTGCIVVNPGGASYITFSSPDVEVTLYRNADCTGDSKTVSTDINFCDDSFDQGGGLNDQVGSVQVRRISAPPLPPVLN